MNPKDSWWLLGCLGFFCLVLFFKYISLNHSLQNHCFGNLLSQSCTPKSQITQIPHIITENILQFWLKHHLKPTLLNPSEMKFRNKGKWWEGNEITFQDQRLSARSKYFLRIPSKQCLSASTNISVLFCRVLLPLHLWLHKAFKDGMFSNERPWLKGSQTLLPTRLLTVTQVGRVISISPFTL